MFKLLAAGSTWSFVREHWSLSHRGSKTRRPSSSRSGFRSTQTSASRSSNPRARHRSRWSPLPANRPRCLPKFARKSPQSRRWAPQPRAPSRRSLRSNAPTRSTHAGTCRKQQHRPQRSQVGAEREVARDNNESRTRRPWHRQLRSRRKSGRNSTAMMQKKGRSVGTRQLKTCV